MPPRWPGLPLELAPEHLQCRGAPSTALSAEKPTRFAEQPQRCSAPSPAPGQQSDHHPPASIHPTCKQKMVWHRCLKKRSWLPFEQINTSRLQQRRLGSLLF